MGHLELYHTSLILVILQMSVICISAHPFIHTALSSF